MSGTISYDASQHKALETELKKIGDNFDDLMTELSHLQSKVDDSLEGNATESLSKEISLLLGKLRTEKNNWSTVIKNANEVERLIKEADEKSSQAIAGGGDGGSF